ncbi:Scaffold protein for [4Fe-4S] cluster assembly ApbC, MRP-like [Candidatus Phaeomarinobacter ectocarpi]|uniref:Iron-sulfur cluster carrier protein n=1 Tax=Candidatus Phaeomarinibacter ectocarpi TaxID=1458461 RepID=X5MBZ1_9HYPH|nr:Mrp/NBP35 family ATP-binding protein [Candidatus Phaeomarinobacter ectocarpi]CDO58647.1 Scaffold protein for [4Fe-4S] cluster assembly ApbC, MRP-like [Candidatus Phaeomarinobacter ectocarpi]
MTSRSGPNRDQILAALATVSAPNGKTLPDAGLVQGLVIRDGNVGFALEIDPAQAEVMEEIRVAAAAAVKDVPGVLSVTAVLTAHNEAPSAPPPRQDAAPQAPTHAPGGKTGPLDIPGVGAIVAVASGKGGVGKSTLAVNLALGLHALGLKVGLLDADVYGPSIPRMLGLNRKPDASESKKLIPLEAYGIKAMSIGLIVEEDTPMIWRGPMVQSAISQMLVDVEWAPIDVLIVDMPPGTGDAQLTLAQRVPMTGAVIVSTPQEIALIDARKAVAMFEKTRVPILGVVENMAWLEMPDGSRNHIFGEGGARKTAEKLNVPFLGEVPLITAIREGGDDGRPVSGVEPDGPSASVFKQIAAGLMASLENTGQKPAPRIVVTD